MQVLALDHVALPVSDLAVSCQFYRQVLCLEPLPRPNFSFPGAWYKLGPTQELHLLRRGTTVLGPTQSYDRHFALKVRSVIEAAEHLAYCDWTFRAPKQRPDGVWQVFLKDPDGHSIELFGENPRAV